ncbi:uncharacterized protein LOC120675194 [Panicum virgatum]|uniref:Uncharacterized protein n=1 Tax=Panicum virgatum TaxID=38727 RepID=A0A8T0RK46_PANVG|nr:uncharacterized protein LOC120675194 [Panicum virgatum]KAG2586367.1 hypothetical protein PVAP13_5NG048300 [Panicum virgatum]
MASQPETLALAGLIILNFLLTAAALFVQLRRLLRTRRRPPQQQPQAQPIPALQPPGTEAAAREPPAPAEGEGEEHGDEGGREKQRRRRRARRRRQPQEEGAGGGGGDGDAAAAAAAPSAKAAGSEGKAKKEELLPRRRPQFPLASVAGALQRRINARYDDLARASEARCLTIEQVNEFINCLIDARNELLQRCENVQRSFKIKKAMLSNHRNYRSSYDRLFEQVRRLEAERDNLKKDAAIYNYIQERLQKSVPYKMIMELSAMEMEAPEISFEELLAKEKEDTAFWQRDGKMRSISSK